MQFPESWLREFCNPPLSTQQLADTLTMAGLEVEELKPVAPRFTHIVVGSAEVSYLVFAGELPWSDFWMVFAGPTLAGNIIGGSFIFALISHAQIRSESGVPKETGKAKQSADQADKPDPQQIKK